MYPAWVCSTPLGLPVLPDVYSCDRTRKGFNSPQAVTCCIFCGIFSPSGNTVLLQNAEARVLIKHVAGIKRNTPVGMPLCAEEPSAYSGIDAGQCEQYRTLRTSKRALEIPVFCFQPHTAGQRTKQFVRKKKKKKGRSHLESVCYQHPVTQCNLETPPSRVGAQHRDHKRHLSKSVIRPQTIQ